jgi:integrase
MEENTAKPVIIHFTEAKETQVKITQLRLIEKSVLCTNIAQYKLVKRTEYLQTNLPTDHTLLLTYLDQDNKESASIKSGTIAGWLSTVMKDTGINTKIHTPHSFRSAASTKAVERGHSIQPVKQHANWSQKTSTFEKYYYKLTTQESQNSSIANSIFSFTENCTTWKAWFQHFFD